MGSGRPSGRVPVLEMVTSYNAHQKQQPWRKIDIPSSRFSERRLVRLLDPCVVQPIQRHLEVPLPPRTASSVAVPLAATAG